MFWKKWSVLLVLLVLAAFVGRAPSARDEKGKVLKGETSKVDGALGFIDSVEPCGGMSGAPAQVTFTAKATFRGEGFGPTAKEHTFTLRLIVVDEDGNLICIQAKEWLEPDGESGCIKCPVTCTSTDKLQAGAYFVSATLTDKGPDGKKKKIDAKSCALIISQ